MKSVYASFMWENLPLTNWLRRNWTDWLRSSFHEQWQFGCWKVSIMRRIKIHHFSCKAAIGLLQHCLTLSRWPMITSSRRKLRFVWLQCIVANHIIELNIKRPELANLYQIYNKCMEVLWNISPSGPQWPPVASYVDYTVHSLANIVIKICVVTHGARF